MRHPGLVATLAAVVAVSASCSSGARVQDLPGSVGSVRTVATVPVPTSPTAVEPSVVGPDDWRDTRASAVRLALAAVLRDAAAGNVRTALSRVAPDSRDEIGALLGRMRAMRAGAFVVLGVTETAAPVPAPAGTTVAWDARAKVAYRLDGFDTASRSFTLELSLRADPTRPQQALLTGWRPGDRPQPWDLAGLRVRRTPGTLLLVAGSARRLEEVATRARIARARVADVLGEAAPAVWVVPAADADAGRLLGRAEADLKGVAAATDGPIGRGRPAGADRVVIAPGAWAALSGKGREVVMTHELTHVTTRRTATRGAPLWLEEGLAEYIAYREVDLPERVVAGPAVDLVRRSGLPERTPSAADFDPSEGRLQEAYAASLVLARTIAARHGSGGLVRLHAAVTGGAPVPSSLLRDPEGTTDRLIRSVLDDDRDSILRAWRKRLAALADG